MGQDSNFEIIKDQKLKGNKTVKMVEAENRETY